MKKKKSLALVCSIAIIFVMAAFSLTSPPRALAKSIELSFAIHIPAKAAPYHSAFLPWAKEIEKRTNGGVKFKFYLSRTLLKPRDAYDGIVTGIADMAWGAHAWTKGRFPLISVMDLPFLSPGTFGGAHVLNDLYKKFPQMKAEHDDVHILFLWCTLPYEIHTAKKPVRKLEDIKGMKLATQPGALEVVRGLGAVPVTMPSPKIYQTVAKGVADGSALAWGAYKAWKLVEVTKYHTNVNLGSNSYWAAMNKKTWSKLPYDIQAVINEVTAQMMPDKLCGAVTKEGNIGMEMSRKQGHEIIKLSSGERARWKATAKPAWDKWVKDMEAKGLPGQAVFDEATKLSKGYTK